MVKRWEQSIAVVPLNYFMLWGIALQDSDGKKMHHRWVCAKGRDDYLQQVHLRIFHSSKHRPRFWQTQAQTGLLVNNVVADWRLQPGPVQVARQTMEQCEGAAVHVWKSQSILPFVCLPPPASAAPDRPAGLVVSPFPSPAARRSRSRATLRGWTEENLKKNGTGNKNGRGNPVNGPRRSAVKILKWKKTTKRTLSNVISGGQRPWRFSCLLMSVLFSFN